MPLKHWEVYLVAAVLGFILRWIGGGVDNSTIALTCTVAAYAVWGMGVAFVIINTFLKRRPKPSDTKYFSLEGVMCEHCSKNEAERAYEAEFGIVGICNNCWEEAIKIGSLPQ